MSYTPTNWNTGDTITASALNKIEQGIANAGGELITLPTTDTGYSFYTTDNDAPSFNDLVTAYTNGATIRIIREGAGWSLMGQMVGFNTDDGYLFFIIGTQITQWQPTNDADDPGITWLYD